MRVIYKQAMQGHIVPKQALEARGPFSKYEPEVVDLDTTPPFPIGATAQNGMREVVFYECNRCGAVVRDYDTDSHVCADSG